MAKRCETRMHSLLTTNRQDIVSEFLNPSIDSGWPTKVTKSKIMSIVKTVETVVGTKCGQLTICNAVNEVAIEMKISANQF